MLYEVQVLNCEETIVLDELALFQEKSDAIKFKELHKYEVAENERMVVVEKSINSLGNIPSTVYVRAQTFTHQFKDEESPVTSTTIECIETFIQGIKLPGNIPLEVGKAVVFKDDEYVDKSYTVLYPISSKDLLESVYSRVALCAVAEKLAKKFTNAVGEVCFIDNFNIKDYI